MENGMMIKITYFSEKQGELHLSADRQEFLLAGNCFNSKQFTGQPRGLFTHLVRS
jgi:hypothetical protein